MKRIKQNLSIEQANRVFIQLPSGQVVYATNAQVITKIQALLIASGIIDSLLPINDTDTFWHEDC